MATAYSQNGWTVIWENGPQLTTIPLIIGKVRAGDVAVIFADLINELRKRIGVNNKGDDWGWNVRPIRGQVNGYSNHASATAIDVDATDHPRGVRGTWSAADKDEIHNNILDRYDGHVRWGEDYNPNLSKVDGMHFEIIGTAAQIKAVANRLRNGGIDVEPVGNKPDPKPDPKKNSAAHRSYAKGEVASIQRALNYAGYDVGPEDDDYGNRTEAGVKSYQRQQQFPLHGLRADGDWGPTTQAHYEWTRRLQNTLNKWAAVRPNLRIDGDFRSETTRAVEQVQRDNLKGAYRKAGGRKVDGDPGPITCKMLNMPNHP
jgi:peptidoglycan hydrolase-like protein with peptidoglycan-binding domain